MQLFKLSISNSVSSDKYFCPYIHPNQRLATLLLLINLTLQSFKKKMIMFFTGLNIHGSSEPDETGMLKCY